MTVVQSATGYKQAETDDEDIYVPECGTQV